MAYATAGGYLTPAKPKPLASALAGGSNPFGFQTARNTTGYRDPLAALTPTKIVQPTQPYTPPAPRVQPVPAAAPAGPNTAPTAPGPTTPPGLYDLNTDPALQQVYAYTATGPGSDQAAQAQALADKTRLVEQSGLASLAQALGLGPDVASVAAGNPFSTAASLKHTFDVNTQDLATQNQQQTKGFNDQANAANLWYSGYRQDQLAKLADAFAKAQAETTRGYQGGLSDLAGNVQGQVGQIGSALAQALAANQAAKIQAEQAARDRQVQMALAGGYTFGGFNPDGSPILLAPTTASTGAAPAATTGGEAGGGAATIGQPPLMTIAQAIQNYGIGQDPRQRTRFIGL